MNGKRLKDMQVEAGTAQAPLRTYPKDIPARDAPPTPAFTAHCWRCHVALCPRIWHHATKAQEPHWERCDPPVMAVSGLVHTVEACQRIRP